MAVRTLVEFENLYGLTATGFPDNTTGLITAEVMRQFGKDIADTFLLLNDYTSGVSAVYSTDIKYYEQDDFIYATNTLFGWSVVTTGTGTTVNTNTAAGMDNTEHVIGVTAIAPGTVSPATTAMIKGDANQFIFGNGHSFINKWRSLLSIASDGTNAYTVWVGFQDQLNTSGTPTDGVFFRYTHSVNGGRWEAVCRAASTETAVDTGVAAITTTVFQTLEIRVNAAGTSATFYIDGTLTNTVTTNIPTGGNFCGLGAKIERSAGTSNRTLYFDWYELLITRTTAR
jgi:hypothetical protein